MAIDLTGFKGQQIRDLLDAYNNPRTRNQQMIITQLHELGVTEPDIAQYNGQEDYGKPGVDYLPTPNPSAVGSGYQPGSGTPPAKKPIVPPNPNTGGTPEDYKTLPVPNTNQPGIQQDYETPANMYDFLKKPIEPNAGPASFADRYKAPTDTSSGLFDQLLGSINSQSGANSDITKQLLDQIDQETAGQVGSLKSDFLDRGLGGPGQISDIEAAGLGDLRAGAVKAKTGAKLNLAKQNADALASAYGSRYTAGTSADAANKALYGQGALQDAQLSADLLKTNQGEQNKRDVALAQILQQQEIERLARKSGKYTSYAPVKQPDSYSISLPGVGGVTF